MIMDEKPKRPVKIDNLLICFGAGAFATILFGARGCEGVSKIAGLGEGWPDILQGITGLLFMLCAGGRALILLRRSKRKE